MHYSLNIFSVIHIMLCSILLHERLKIFNNYNCINFLNKKKKSIFIKYSAYFNPEHVDNNHERQNN